MGKKIDWANVLISAKNASELAKIKKTQEASEQRNREELEQISRANKKLESELNSQKKSRKRQEKIRRWLLQFSESYDSIQMQVDPVLRLQKLGTLGARMGKLSPAEFDDFERQQHFLKLKSQVKQAVLNAATEIGQANVDMLTGLNVQLPLIKKESGRLIQLRHDALETLPSEEDVVQWRDSLEELQETVLKIRELDEKADKVSLEQHADYNFVEISEQLSKRIELDSFVLKCTTLIIKSDRSVDRTEQIAFDHLRRRLLFPVASATEIFETTRQIKPSDFSGDEDDALAVVTSLSNIAFADGAMHKREFAMLKAIAKAVGISELKLDEIVQQAADDPGSRAFDGAKLIQSFADSSFKDMKNLCFGDDIPNKLLESVGFAKENAAAIGEFPVVSYSNKLLGATAGTILVSDQRIYQKSSGANEATTPLNLAEIVQIEDASLFSATIAIKTRSQEIKVPNFFGAFLEVVKPFLAGLANNES